MGSGGNMFGGLMRGFMQGIEYKQQKKLQQYQGLMEMANAHAKVIDTLKDEDTEGARLARENAHAQQMDLMQKAAKLVGEKPNMGIVSLFGQLFMHGGKKGQEAPAPPQPPGAPPSTETLQAGPPSSADFGPKPQESAGPAAGAPQIMPTQPAQQRGGLGVFQTPSEKTAKYYQPIEDLGTYVNQQRQQKGQAYNSTAARNDPQFMAKLLAADRAAMMLSRSGHAYDINIALKQNFPEWDLQAAEDFKDAHAKKTLEEMKSDPEWASYADKYPQHAIFVKNHIKYGTPIPPLPTAHHYGKAIKEADGKYWSTAYDEYNNPVGKIPGEPTETEKRREQSINGFVALHPELKGKPAAEQEAAYDKSQAEEEQTIQQQRQATLKATMTRQQAAEEGLRLRREAQELGRQRLSTSNARQMYNMAAREAQHLLDWNELYMGRNLEDVIDERLTMMGQIPNDVRSMMGTTGTGASKSSASQDVIDRISGANKPVVNPGGEQALGEYLKQHK